MTQDKKTRDSEKFSVDIKKTVMKTGGVESKKTDLQAWIEFERRQKSKSTKG